jgi:hypothetical protein
MNKSEQINELAGALAKAQAEIKGALKDAQNPFFKSSYADLASVWDAIRAPLAKHGLSVIQTTDSTEKGMVLVTTLAHASGQWIEGRYPIQPMKNDPQAMGSATTYARRYALAAIVGVAQIDDDGEAAMARPRLPGGMVAPRVVPEQPGAEDGTPNNDGIWRFPGGSYNGKNLKHRKFNELSLEEHRAYIEKVESYTREKGKPLPEWWDAYLAVAEPEIAKAELETANV